MKLKPVVCLYHEDGTFTVLPRFRHLASQQFTPGEQYPLEVVSYRSRASHNHYFAALADAWDNLPHDLQEKWPSPEHMRHDVLVKCGYFTEKTLVLSSNDQARRVAATMRSFSPFAVITVSGKVVKIYEAESQAVHGAHAMNKERFQQSKTDVLNYVADLIGVKASDLKKQAARVAPEKERTDVH